MLKGMSLGLALTVGCLTGCSGENHSDQSHHQVEIGHAAHPEHGPNGGELIELGKESYHLELLHDDDNVKVNVLDGSATDTVAIEATTIQVNLKFDGQVRSFELTPSQPLGDGTDAVVPADPGSGEPAKVTTFVSSDPKLSEWLDQGAEGAVMVRIDGKSFNGALRHDHDHGEHDHHDHSEHEHEHD